MEQGGNSLGLIGGVKLEGKSNWNMWKFQTTVLLRAQDVFSVVEGVEVLKEENKAEWTSKDAKAQGLIVMRLTENAMIHIISCNMSAEMWHKLISVYEQRSSTAIHILQQKFFTYKFSEEIEVQVFLSKLQELKLQLAQAGEAISDKLVITKVLMSLPEKYSHFVSAWEAVEPAKQTYEDLVARLLVEEERMKVVSICESMHL